MVLESNRFPTTPVAETSINKQALLLVTSLLLECAALGPADPVPLCFFIAYLSVFETSTNEVNRTRKLSRQPPHKEHLAKHTLEAYI